MKAVKVDEPNQSQTKVDVDDGFSIRDALNILFCHKWKIVLFFLTVTSMITIITYRAPFIYSSSASLLIGVGRERIDVAPVLKPTQFLNQGQIERVNNEMVILKSRYLAAQTVDSIGLKHFFELFKKKKTEGFPLQMQIEEIGNTTTTIEYEKAQLPLSTLPSSVSAEQQALQSALPKSKPKPKCQLFTEQAHEKEYLKDDIRLFSEMSEVEKDNFWHTCQAAISIIIGGLTVEAKPQSFIINLGMNSRNPLLAHLSLKYLIKAYLTRYIELRTPKDSIDVFKTRFEKVSLNLELAEKALYDFRQQHQIAELPTQVTMLLSRVGELTNRINSVTTDLSSLQIKIEALEALLPHYKKEIELQRVEGRTNYVADGLKTMLYKFQTEESELSAFYPDDSRKVKEVKERIALVQEALNAQPTSLSEVTRGINRQHETHQMSLDTARIDYTAAQAQLSVLKEELTQRQQQLSELTSHELTIRQLERKVELARQAFADDLDVLKRADSYQALDDSKIVSVDVIENPSYDAEPIKPNKPMNIVIGIIFAALGGIGLAFILDYFDDSMKTTEDVKRRLQLPVLAMISSGDFYKCI